MLTLQVFQRVPAKFDLVKSDIAQKKEKPLGFQIIKQHEVDIFILRGPKALNKMYCLIHIESKPG